MKLFIQIPCFNEEKTLPLVIKDLPREIAGIDEIYTLVIDDGSTDKTVESAKELGVDYIVCNQRNIGLSKTFNKGIEACLYLGADIIVNTDGDNQYQGQDISKLVKKLINENCDIVVGCRDIKQHNEFSGIKKFLHLFGSKIVCKISNTNVPDTTSGFRALNKISAMNISIINSFSYTLEMLIQAGRTDLDIDWIPIKTNSKLRESRLFKSNTHFIWEQLKVIFTAYVFYCPTKIFNFLAAISLTISILMSGRIFYFLRFAEETAIKFKTGSGILLLFTSVLTVLFFITGLLSSILSGMRFLMFDIRNRIRNIELNNKNFAKNINIITSPKFFEWKK